MRELDLPRLVVDFNEMVEQDVVLLSRHDTRRDSAGNLIELRAGLRVHLYMEDADANGVPSLLLATGVVEPNVASDWSSQVRWRCRIEKWEATRVYVRLLGEGTVVFRPAVAVDVGDGVYRLLAPSEHEPQDEEWEFKPNSLVRVEERTLEGQRVSVAVSAA